MSELTQIGELRQIETVVTVLGNRARTHETRQFRFEVERALSTELSVTVYVLNDQKLWVRWEHLDGAASVEETLNLGLQWLGERWPSKDLTDPVESGLRDQVGDAFYAYANTPENEYDSPAYSANVALGLVK